MVRHITSIVILVLAVAFTMSGCDSDGRKKINELHDRDPAVRIEALDDIGMHDWLNRKMVIDTVVDIAKNDDDMRVRFKAVRVLPQVTRGRGEYEAILPELMETDDPAFKAFILGNCCTFVDNEDTDFIPLFLGNLDDDNNRVRENAAILLGAFNLEQLDSELGDGGGDKVIYKLLALLRNDEDRYVRIAAGITLAYMAPDIREPIPVFIDAMLKGRRRPEAILALRVYDPPVSGLVNMLLQIIRETTMSPYFMDMIKAYEHGTDFLELLREMKPDSYTLEYLEELDPDRVEYDDDALLIYKDGVFVGEIIHFYSRMYDTNLESAATFTLRGISLGDEDIQLLVTALDDPNFSVKEAAVYSLVENNPEQVDVLGLIIPLLDENDAETRHLAANVMTQFGEEEAGRIVPVLIVVLDDPEPTVRGRAVISLGVLGPSAKDAVDSLTRLLDDESRDVRESAVTSLVRIWEPGNMKQNLEALIDNHDKDVRKMAVGYYAYLGIDAFPFLIEKLQEATENEDKELIILYIMVLNKLLQPDEVILHFAELIADESNDTLIIISEALKFIERDASSSFENLGYASKDNKREKEIRKAARDTIRLIENSLSELP